MASGSDDKTIRVWDVEAGTLEQSLEGHGEAVFALVACGQRLISSSMDKSLKVWSMATWACVQTVQAYAVGSAQFIGRLAVSGSTLVGGSCSHPLSRTEEHEARVWDLETLEPQHTLRQSAGKHFLGLASDGGEVWGAVGKDVVVWGKALNTKEEDLMMVDSKSLLDRNPPAGSAVRGAGGRAGAPMGRARGHWRVLGAPCCLLRCVPTTPDAVTHPNVCPGVRQAFLTPRNTASVPSRPLGPSHLTLMSELHARPAQARAQLVKGSD